MGHEAACDAAVAVRLAADRGKRDLMVSWLYANQPETPAARQTMPDRVKAKTIEMLGIKDYEAAYALTLPAIRKDVSDGQAVGIRGTPTYFINGVRAADEQGGTLPIHFMELAIQYELTKRSGR